MSVRRALLLFVVGLAACGDFDEEDSLRMLQWPLKAQCSITVVGKGQKAMETDYLPHVVNCENGAASLEALKVQAVSARTFAYYKIATAGSVKDGTSDQVYSCGSQPSQKHYDAVKATAGQVVMWSGVVICSFFVAGAKPSTQSCVALASDPDPTGTERYVTYNEGKTGSQVKQTTLGWVSSTNKYNRGCMSQNGSHCQAVKGKKYQDILRFYYGADINIETAIGSCVTPPKPDAGVGPDRTAPALTGPDSGAPPEEGDLLVGPAPEGPPPAEQDASAPAPQTLGPPLTRAWGGCQLPAGRPAGELLAALALLPLLALARSRRQRPGSRVR